MKYQEMNLDDVMKYFVDAFSQKVEAYEYFVDQHKGKVVFKLFIEEKEDEQNSAENN